MSTVFSEDLNLKIRYECKPDYSLYSLLFCITAARFPAFISHEKRLQSLAAAHHLDDEEKRTRWSNAGFFLEADGSAACFHCAAKAHIRSQDWNSDPLDLHERCSGSCELLRLLKVADRRLNEANERVRESAARLRRAIGKLREDLSHRTSLITMVESFGFDRRSILFCACRIFMRNGGKLPERAGELVEEIQQCEDVLTECSQVFDIEAALGRRSGSEEPSNDGVRRDADQSERTRVNQVARCAEETAHERHLVLNAGENAIQNNAADTHAADMNAPAVSDSDKCIQCNSAVRDHVTLPCAHFAMCQSCLTSASNCPKCGKRILAVIKAYIC